MLQQECTRQTCPEMKAGEWLYLCVAHGNEGAMEVRANHMTTSRYTHYFEAMLCDRLHPAHTRQRNRSPELSSCVPITVSAYRDMRIPY